MSDLLQRAQALELIDTADRQLALHLGRLASDTPPWLSLLIALTSARVRQGHVCLDLERDPDLARLAPAIDHRALARHPLLAPQGPLVLAGRRLYLARYHAWEEQILQALRRRLAGPRPAVDEERLRADLTRLFPQDSPLDWQRVAATLAVLQPFLVISGGPGTGKTWTAARILELLRRQPGGEGLRLALAAPTGKAAARLADAIAQAGGDTPQALTLHRLLGMRPGRVQPRHHAADPLPLDLLLVDELSMVDLPMMARLLAALPPQARLILLGDHHQLASVEAGQVMADLCGPGVGGYRPALARRIQALSGDRLPLAEGDPPPMADHLVILRRSRRFDDQRGIGRLAAAVNRGDSEGALAALAQGDDALAWHSADPRTVQSLLQRHLLPLSRRLARTHDPRQALDTLGHLRLLCALREGPQGVNHLNALVERALGVEGQRFYPGRPVMITVNAPQLGLYNGDLGVILEQADGTLRAWFPDPQEGARALAPSRLPRHETVHAMTIHKAQGSEFDRVILLLPDRDTPLVTRELLYTGITRARHQLHLCADQARLRQAIGRRVERASGLRDGLWAPRANPPP